MALTNIFNLNFLLNNNICGFSLSILRRKAICFWQFINQLLSKITLLFQRVTHDHVALGTCLLLFSFVANSLAILVKTSTQTPPNRENILVESPTRLPISALYWHTSSITKRLRVICHQKSDSSF